LTRAADVPLSTSLLSSFAQPPPLDKMATAQEGGNIDDVLANIQVWGCVSSGFGVLRGTTSMTNSERSVCQPHPLPPR
jgi:hypothetical protein